jgi:hypothetical protein
VRCSHRTDAPRVRAEEHVRQQFYHLFVDGEEDRAKSEGAKRHAFKRAAAKLTSESVIDSQNDARGRAMYWFRRDEAG